jgi:hypothetical protein
MTGATKEDECFDDGAIRISPIITESSSSPGIVTRTLKVQ